jgi:hypothetical protein
VVLPLSDAVGEPRGATEERGIVERRLFTFRGFVFRGEDNMNF